MKEVKFLTLLKLLYLSYGFYVTAGSKVLPSSMSVKLSTNTYKNS